jgi:hypothetical protein
MTGGDPPYKPEAMAEYKKNMAEIAAGKIDDDMSRHFCLPDGVPRGLESPYPFEILEAPNRGEIYLLYEINHMIRRIDMQNPLPPQKDLELLPFYAGHSAGHWEGDTLVIETSNFNPERAWRGTSDKMKLVERITRVDADTLEYTFTVNDPETWTKPWTASTTLRKSDGQLYEYACHEGNYSEGNILAGARALEKKAAKK